jgi:kojibiose phosphorylase
MAQWNLERARDVAFWMKERHRGPWARLAEGIGLGPDEPERWGEIARAMYTGFNPATKLYEQFRGYFQLEDLDLNAYAGRRLPMDLLLGKARIERSQVVKQPDVVMAVYLLWDRLAPDVREANFRYYEPRTGHGSSLSPPIHAAVAARLGDRERALKYFDQTCAIDLSETGSYSARGIHIGALGGLWQSVVLGFCGLSVGPEGLSIHPHLPSDWRRITFVSRWHGRRQEFHLELPRALPGAAEPPVPTEPVLVGPHRAVAKTSPEESFHRGGGP